MIDLTKKLDEISISSSGYYQKATELIDNCVFDPYSEEGKKRIKIIEEINRYHFNQENEKKLEENKQKIENPNIKKSII